MSIGSNNTEGQKIVTFAEAGFLARDAFQEGFVAVHWSGSGYDNKDVCLPNNTSATLNGRSFLGIWQSAATAVIGEKGSLIKGGIAKCQLKANSAVAKVGGLVGYDPADGGYVVPYTGKNQICIGRFTQEKATVSVPQFVGVQLTGDTLDGAAGVLGRNLAATTAITNTDQQTAFTVATPVVLPANSLSVGSVLHIRAQANVTGVNAGDKVIVDVRFGGLTGQILATTPTAGGGTAVSVGHLATIDTTVTVCSLGATGKLFSAGMSGCGAPLTSTMFQTGSAGQITVDTTVANEITATAKWDNANAANLIVLEDFVITKLN